MEDNKQARRWFFTINNEKRTDEEFSQYITGLEHFKYVMFQRERGEKEKTEHIQMFLIFSVAKRFSTVKKLFPRAHIEEVKGTNIQARDYCSKSETRVSGPYEFGEFAEERARTDVKGFLQLVKEGVDSETISGLYPSMYLRNLGKVEQIRQNALYEKFRKVMRDVEVTYIYGPPGSGKTKYIVDTFGLGNFYDVPVYDKSAFDKYAGEDVIVFDEFNSQFKIPYMNKLIDRYPVLLPARYSNKVACYTKIYIVSNLPLDKQYEFVQMSKPELYHAFCRRIHNILRIDFKGMTWEQRNGLKEIPVAEADVFDELFGVVEDDNK